MVKVMTAGSVPAFTVRTRITVTGADGIGTGPIVFPSDIVIEITPESGRFTRHHNTRFGSVSQQRKSAEFTAT
jgi:hypothetical protein